MKTIKTSAFAALRRDRQNLLAVALVGAMSITMARAQTDSGYYRPITLAPAEPEAGGGGGAAAEPAAGGGAPDAAELAKKLQNPLAAMISAPLQNNFDFGAGPNHDGFQYLLRIQPVIPISLTKDWNIISRTILPVVYQEKIYGTSSQAGLGDTLQSFFFSPKQLFHGWIWGVGPVFQLPTATDGLLGQGKWGAGPTAVVLRQDHGWTYGLLLNHVWSFAGQDDRMTVSQTFLQPFLSYTLKTHTTFALNSESSYNWVGSQWTVPLNLSVKQLVKIGGAPVQFELGGRYYADKPAQGPDWGLRFTVTFLLPK